MTTIIQKSKENYISEKHLPYEAITKISTDDFYNATKNPNEAKIKSLATLNTKVKEQNVIHLSDDKLTDISDSLHTPVWGSEINKGTNLTGRKRGGHKNHANTKNSSKRGKLNFKNKKRMENETIRIEESSEGDLKLKNEKDTKDKNANQGNEKGEESSKPEANKENEISQDKKVKIENENKNLKSNEVVISQKEKKLKTTLNLKELKKLNEEKLMTQINKEYTDKEYHEDMEVCLKNKLNNFMKENFSSMYRKDKFYLYHIIPQRKRATLKNCIMPKNLNNDIEKRKDSQTIYSDLELEEAPESNSVHSIIELKENIEYSEHFQEKLNSKRKNTKESTNSNSNSGSEEIIEIKEVPQKRKRSLNNNIILIKDIDFEINFRKANSLLPKKVWSAPGENFELDIDKFYDDCAQLWPHSKCNFVKSIALEFLMKNHYSTELCIDRLSDFVEFMKKRALELDFPLQSNNSKTVKQYNLRKTKKN